VLKCPYSKTKPATSGVYTNGNDMRDQIAEITIPPGPGVLVEMADTGERLLEELYDTYSRPLFRYALALTCSPDDAEDAVQVVFVRVSREWKRLVRVENVKAYLFSAVRNAAFNILRGKRRRDTLHESICSEYQANQQAGDGELRVDGRALREALDELPVDQREVLVLKVFDQMTFKEIADTVGASLNTVASRYRYGIDKLRQALEVSDNG